MFNPSSYGCSCDFIRSNFREFGATNFVIVIALFYTN